MRMNYTNFHIDKNAETISHLVSECGKIAQKEYKRNLDNVARYVHGQLCDKGGFERADKWYEQQTEAVIENENFKLLWDFIM